MGRLNTHNTRHIHDTSITVKQYLQEHIMKGTGYLEDICADTNSVEHNKVFNPYAAGLQVSTQHNGKWEDKTPIQQIEALMLGQVCQVVDRTVM